MMKDQNKPSPQEELYRRIDQVADFKERIEALARSIETLNQGLKDLLEETSKYRKSSGNGSPL
ncbi:hypothetical protein [Nostoc sp. CHAB 5836]|uniref:hypothetical protein n=1 Tax=Nostoc sp. CHAB 5836 TaxID=2780404 RepID=UPI001E527052|nr:hypothetical protein [Nostoc sp. CHAB 5836]